MANRKKRIVGWHATGQPPREGKGSATVEPIRKRRDIKRITRLLDDRPRDLALWLFGINTGFRASDIIGSARSDTGLRWRDVMDEQGSLRRVLRIRETKTGNARRLPLNDKVRAALSRLLREQGGPDAVDPDELVFPSPRGGAMTLQNFHRLVKRWTREVGAEGNFGTHSLRKTFGYHLHERGAPILEIMNIFGHTSPAVTLRYIGVDEARRDRRIMELDLG